MGIVEHYSICSFLIVTKQNCHIWQGDQLFKSSNAVTYFIFFSCWGLWENCYSQCSKLTVCDSWKRVLSCQYETLFPFPAMTVEIHHRVSLQCPLSWRECSGYGLNSHWIFTRVKYKMTWNKTLMFLFTTA